MTQDLVENTLHTLAHFRLYQLNYLIAKTFSKIFFDTKIVIHVLQENSDDETCLKKA